MTSMLLQAEGVSIGYGENTVIRDLSLEIERGTFVGLLGANGAGKTTLLLALSGQYEPRRGRVLLGGIDAYRQNLACKRKIGFVHEDPFLYPYLTVEEFLYFIARVRRIDRDEAGGRIEELLDTLQLVPQRSKPTQHLSMGMRKKLALAAALLARPELLFLDEALNGVDLESAFAIKQMLRDFVACGGAVILSTHALEVLEKLADRYVLMRHGDIIAEASAETLKRSAGDRDLEDHVLRLLKGAG